LANTASAEKRNRQSQKRRQANLHVRSGMKGAIKKVREALVKGDAALARDALHQASRAIDKAASMGVVHRNAAARKISRLARAVAQAGAPAK
jgi:small subunit ribosomal protein S20